MCMLQGVTMLQVEATPICDFLKSSALKPTACSMARLAARSGPSTTIEEKARSAGAPFFWLGRDDLELTVAINKGSEFHPKPADMQGRSTCPETVLMNRQIGLGFE